jgi:type II secretory pathway pseudopilin PulG
MGARRRDTGFTYLTALFLIAIMSAGLAALGQMWQTASLRDREAELLYTGNQYRLAIQRYYLSGPQQYPRTFQDLLKDPRQAGVRRHLRQLYPDPMTNSPEWAIVKGPDGGIMGVYSKSEDTPLKVTNFKLRDRDFENAKKYSDWKFVYLPPAAPAAGTAIPATSAGTTPGAASPLLPGAAPAAPTGAPVPPGMAAPGATPSAPAPGAIAPPAAASPAPTPSSMPSPARP